MTHVAALARLAAFTEIHEHWHFEEGLTEEQFDEFMHGHINAARKALKALDALVPAQEEIDPYDTSRREQVIRCEP